MISEWEYYKNIMHYCIYNVAAGAAATTVAVAAASAAAATIHVSIISDLYKLQKIYTVL